VAGLRAEFIVHRLNQDGMERVARVAVLYSDLLQELEALAGSAGREMSIVRTKLEEAAFFTNRAIALRDIYQQPPTTGAP